MLEAQVEIPDALASEGYKRAMALRAVGQIGGYYSRNLAVIWVVIAIADAFANAGHLIFYHFLFLLAVAAVATAMRHYDWSKEVAAMKGWTFHAKLDDDGVVTQYSLLPSEHRGWEFYRNYVEYDSYLQIEDQNGGFSFLPKTPELFEIIEFTRSKIPEKK